MLCRTTLTGETLLVCAAVVMCSACGPEGTSLAPSTNLDGIDLSGDDASSDGSLGDSSASDASVSDAGSPSAPTVGDAYVPVADWSGPCSRTTVIDVNLGLTATSFVNAAYCQIYGTAPSTDTVTNWVSQLEMNEYVRRVDVVRTLCNQAGRGGCTLTYSNPWQTTVLPTDTCTRKTTRDVGAVMMFFFNCPLMVNCMMDWANTHAWGMAGADQTYGTGPGTTGYYTPDNTGFWLRELLDARHAGLQFVLPNEYGNDTSNLSYLESALTTIDGMGGGIQVGLFNDTSNWGNGAAGTAMNPAPDLTDTAGSAQRIYDVQWKPFFTTISKPHWYTVKGAPLIYFYNAGTLKPTSGTSALIAALKQLFMADFNVVPFVDVDMGYGPTSSADGQFTWDTFANDATTNFASSTTATGGLTFDTSMVKWDSLGRDKPGTIATSSTRMFKGPDILSSVLDSTASHDLLLLETWNDLGEGTGITRNYDYYYKDQFLPPDAFISLIRASQCSN